MSGGPARGTGNRQSYRWPWLLVGGLTLGIIIAVLWTRQEIKRVQRIRDASAPTQTNSPSGR